MTRYRHQLNEGKRSGTRFTTIFLMAAGMITLLIIGASSFALADCGAAQEKARLAQKGRDLPALRAIFDGVVIDPSCSDEYRALLGRAVGREIERQVDIAVADGRPLDSQETMLREVGSYTKSWRALALLGDIARDRKDFARAGGYYQESLAAIEDEVATPKAPPQPVIETIFKAAEEMRLVSDGFVGAPKTRAGGVSGLAAVSVRGFVPTKVALPIEFQYDSVEFTPKGEAAARELLAMLRQRSPSSATLIGHTDARGRLEYNIELSRRRAMAVALFLRRSGYEGVLNVDGRGPTEPMRLDDPSRYTPDQIHQINRRVELAR